jgi:nicotinate dehydrogenase subunit A
MPCVDRSRCTGRSSDAASGSAVPCTVLVDKTATRSCQLPVSRTAGRDITTLEGLGTPEKPDAVQAAFMAEQAAQCGYCTNGMIMAAKALLARTPKPTVDQIKQALDGNLCRCGTHTRIVRAIQRASRATSERSESGRQV